MALPPKSHQKKLKKQIFWYLVIKTVSNFLIIFCIFGISATFGPALYFEAQYHLSKVLDVNYKVATDVPEGPSELAKIMKRGQSQPNLFGTVMSGKREEILYPQDPQFTVMIPKIGANEKIQENVDPNNEEEYLRVLSQDIAHAKGTAFPGVNGTTYLFAHSIDNFWNVGRYNAVFYLLNKLVVGDDVIVFYDNKRHDYKVTETKIVESNDTHYIASNLGQGERVILQTCWPPGTAWKRLLVFATPK